MKSQGVVTPVIDYALTRDQEIDRNQIALMGISMGSYLAARAAAFKHRISACILCNGVYDGYDAFASGFSQSLRVAVENGNIDVVNTVVGILSDFDANMRFNLKHGMWTTGTNSPFELIQGSKKYIKQHIVCHNMDWIRFFKTLEAIGNEPKDSTRVASRTRW